MYKKLGYVRVGAIIPKIDIGNVEYNRIEIQKQLNEAEKHNIGIAVTPELSLTGYTCQDLFRARNIVKRKSKSIKNITK